MDVQFDFYLHSDPSTLTGTAYFELVPGRYDGKHWSAGARFIDEEAFSVIEGVFEKHVPDYDHFAFVEISRLIWQSIVQDLVALRVALEQALGDERVFLPYGSTFNVQGNFEKDLEVNQRRLATFLTELESWLCRTLVDHDVISVLGL